MSDHPELETANGKVTFDLYYTGLITEPTAASCTAANKVNVAPILALESVAVVGNGDYTTGPITVTKAGYYPWIAHYSADTKGNQSFDSPCRSEIVASSSTSWSKPTRPRGRKLRLTLRKRASLSSQARK